ncbi:MAG: DotD/TraH family lipoprotein [Desulfovibrio sp.]|nr:DotD/TraH family lipoprotein [Desulfovibrio sp.]
MKGFFLCFVLLALLGCSNKNVSDDSEDYVEQKLRMAAEAISADLALMTGSSSRHELGLEGHGGLSRSMDLVYDGDLETALSKVAAHAGYQLVIQGKPPKTPVVIHLAMRGRSCLEVLREIGRQIGKDETLEVREYDHRISLAYGAMGSS